MSLIRAVQIYIKHITLLCQLYFKRVTADIVFNHQRSIRDVYMLLNALLCFRNVDN